MYLIGNVPAIDVLNLERTEGRQYGKDIDLAFVGRITSMCKVISINNIL